LLTPQGYPTRGRQMSSLKNRSQISVSPCWTAGTVVTEPKSEGRSIRRFVVERLD
jgi:hypothetical protein